MSAKILLSQVVDIDAHNRSNLLFYYALLIILSGALFLKSNLALAHDYGGYGDYDRDRKELYRIDINGLADFPPDKERELITARQINNENLNAEGLYAADLIDKYDIFSWTMDVKCMRVIKDKKIVILAGVLKATNPTYSYFITDYNVTVLGYFRGKSYDLPGRFSGQFPYASLTLEEVCEQKVHNIDLETVNTFLENGAAFDGKININEIGDYRDR